MPKAQAATIATGRVRQGLRCHRPGCGLAQRYRVDVIADGRVVARLEGCTACRTGLAAPRETTR